VVLEEGLLGFESSCVSCDFVVAELALWDAECESRDVASFSVM
jgi:hypothetical protein